MSSVKYDYPEYSKLPDVAEGKPSVALSIPKVGIKGFEMPIAWIFSHMAKDCGSDILMCEEDYGEQLTKINVYANVTEEQKGLSMSMIPLTLYEFANRREEGSFEYNFFLGLKLITLSLKENLKADDVYIKLSAKLPFKQKSLKTGFKATKYYPISIQTRSKPNEEELLHYITVTIDYSSSCPCSLELSKSYQKENKNSYPVPHSQRSTAEVTIKPVTGVCVSLREYVELIEDAIKTPTQVLVRRLDEQEFAIRNGEHPKFVEDSARYIKQKLDEQTNIADFVAIITHEESLHPFDVQAIINKGIPNGLR